MDLELSDDEAALRDNVRAVLAGICPPSVVRAVFDGDVAAGRPLGPHGRAGLAHARDRRGRRRARSRLRRARARGRGVRARRRPGPVPRDDHPVRAHGARARRPGEPVAVPCAGRGGGEDRHAGDRRRCRLDGRRRRYDGRARRRHVGGDGNEARGPRWRDRRRGGGDRAWRRRPRRVRDSRRGGRRDAAPHARPDAARSPTSGSTASRSTRTASWPNPERPGSSAPSLGHYRRVRSRWRR